MVWMNVSPDYGRAIRILRGVIDINQAKLADNSGLDRSYISQIEIGRRKPALGAIEKIAAALEMTTAEFVKFAEGLGRANNPQTRTMQNTKTMVLESITLILERFVFRGR